MLFFDLADISKIVSSLPDFVIDENSLDEAADNIQDNETQKIASGCRFLHKIVEPIDPIELK